MNACEVCGKPTASKVGVCQRTKECKRIHGYRFAPLRRKFPIRYCAGCDRKLDGKNTTQFCTLNPECMVKHMAERYKADVIRGSTLNAKRRARKSGVPFDLTRDDIPPIPEFCPVLGIRLCVNTGSPGFSPNSPSLDRIIPELGYVPGNVQWLSFKANAMKRDASPDELVMFAKWVLQEYELERKAA